MTTYKKVLYKVQYTAANICHSNIEKKCYVSLRN